jgi:predicted small secreted protein
LEEAFMKFARVGVAIAAAAIVVAACGGSSGAGKDLKLGISLPLSGSSRSSRTT